MPSTRTSLGMRWWLGARVRGGRRASPRSRSSPCSATARSDAFRTYAQEFAVGNTVAASEALKRARLARRELRDETTAIAARRHLALFVFDREGRPLTPLALGRHHLGEPCRAAARRCGTRSTGGRYIDGRARRLRVRRRRRDPRRPRPASSSPTRCGPSCGSSSASSGTSSSSRRSLAFAVGAALGLLIATLIARRLARIARAAKAIGEGDFDVARPTTASRTRSAASRCSIERMRGQLQELFHALEHDRDRLERLLDRLNEGVLLIDREPERRVRERPRARAARRRASSLDESPISADGMRGELRALAARPLHAPAVRSQLRLARRRAHAARRRHPADGGRRERDHRVEDESERERNERVQREFATNAAHELRTPLASIVTAVEMLQTGAKDEPAARDEFLDVIARESDRLTRLTRALLVLARAERPRRAAAPRRRCAVAPLLEQVAASLPPRSGVEIGVDCPPPLADRRRRRPARAGAVEPRRERGPAHARPAA